jgi:hypothetical protein
MSHGTTDREHFDMLPFIAILMCTLGSLLYVTLIVASLCIGPGAGIGWIPVYKEGQPHKVPVLIEWDGKVATVHRDGKRVRVAWDGLEEVTEESGHGDRGAAASLGEILSDLAARRETHYALFAVRPSGFENFQLFAHQFRQLQIDIGYEPMGEDRPVRLLPPRSRS